jgi:hypothetical protein
MKKEEALAMLIDAPNGDIPSRINRSLTQSQCVSIVFRGIMAFPDNSQIPDLFVKRVYQVVLDRVNPRLPVPK